MRVKHNVTGKTGTLHSLLVTTQTRFGPYTAADAPYYVVYDDGVVMPHNEYTKDTYLEPTP